MLATSLRNQGNHLLLPVTEQECRQHERILNATCMHECRGSVSELCSRIDLLCSQTIHVFCINQVDGAAILLKIILGLDYNNSTYPQVKLRSCIEYAGELYEHAGKLKMQS